MHVPPLRRSTLIRGGALLASLLIEAGALQAQQVLSTEAVELAAGAEAPPPWLEEANRIARFDREGKPSWYPFWGENPFIVRNSYLRERLEGLEARSPAFKAEMDRLRSEGFPIFITTTSDPELRLFYPDMQSLEQGGGYTIWFGTTERIRGAGIVVNLRVLHEMGNSSTKFSRWLNQTVDDILIHEMYGHLSAATQANGYTERCPDPKGVEEGEALLHFCVMAREKVVRSELGLLPRQSYAIQGPDLWP